MTPPDALFRQHAVAALLELASSVAGGEPIGLVDDDGRPVAGWVPGEQPRHDHAVSLGAGPVGWVVGTTVVPPALLALVARSLELGLVSADERAARERLDQELAIGRRIQLALVPNRFPDAPGWTFAAAYEPAREVGGDLFDAFRLRTRDDQVGLLVADVTGKGIPAALMMADLRALLHAATDNAPSPRVALERVNRILVHERSASLFATAALLVLDTATGVVRYASAGHEPPLVARCAGGVDALEAGGPILGAFADAEFEEREATLTPGDALVLYTDGITDTRDADRRFFGEERLLDVVNGACGRAAETIVEAIMAEVRGFCGQAEPFDDLTLLVVERR